MLPCISENAEELSARATLIICPLSVLSNWLVMLFVTHTESPTHRITLMHTLNHTHTQNHTHAHNHIQTHSHSFILNRTSLSSTCVRTSSPTCTCTMGRSATGAHPSWPLRTWCWPPTTSSLPTTLWVMVKVFLTPVRKVLGWVPALCPHERIAEPRCPTTLHATLKDLCLK